MSEQAYLSHFQTIRPSFESSQEHILEWLLAAHTKAEATTRQQDIHSPQINRFHEELKEKLHRVSCKPDTIFRRGHEIKDFLHKNWSGMELYRLEELPQGEGLGKRNQLYAAIVDGIFERYYPEQSAPPHDLIHVSCTGYASPSGAQKIVAKRNWGKQTMIAHAYHMGCYASIPALRIAFGLNKNQNNKEGCTDIVHTELCTLHYNPARHATDQLIIHSLFADGFIKYSALSEKKGPSLKIWGILEQLIPNSTELMLWNLDSYGFSFFLDKEIPLQIARSLPGFFKELCERAGVKETEIIDKAIFAIHPGGPKIIKYIKKYLGCSDTQIQISYSILNKYGNMSSCTLPQMWSEICEDSQIPDGTKVVSIAFGPGLTMAGVILEKVL